MCFTCVLNHQSQNLVLKRQLISTLNLRNFMMITSSVLLYDMRDASNILIVPSSRLKYFKFFLLVKIKKVPIKSELLRLSQAQGNLESCMKCKTSKKASFSSVIKC